MIGMSECNVLLAQCTIYLARAPKSRLMENALRAAQKVVAEHKGPQPGVPLHLRNAPTKLMKNLGKQSILFLIHFISIIITIKFLLFKIYFIYTFHFRIQ